MKVLERLVLAQLRPRVRTFLDPLKFAYQPHLGVNFCYWVRSCGGWVSTTQ